MSEGVGGSSGLLYLKEVLYGLDPTSKCLFHECHRPTNGKVASCMLKLAMMTSPLSQEMREPNLPFCSLLFLTCFDMLCVRSINKILWRVCPVH